VETKHGVLVSLLLADCLYISGPSLTCQTGFQRRNAAPQCLGYCVMTFRYQRYLTSDTVNNGG